MEKIKVNSPEQYESFMIILDEKKYPIAQNAVQLQQGTVMDLYPTILSVAGVDTPKGYALDGADLKKLLKAICLTSDSGAW